MTITQADLDAALAAIRKTTDDQFTLLNQRFREAPTPVPTPTPPPATPAVRFANHRYYGSGPKDAADYYDLQDSEWFKRSDWPANREVYRYATTATNTEPGGWRNILPPHLVEGRVARNSDGTVVSRQANGDQLLDITNAGVRIDSAVWLTQRAVSAGYDGVYLDEVDETYAYGYPSARFPWTVTVWQSAMAALVTSLGATLRGKNKKLWVNLGADYTQNQTFVDSVIANADGVNSEYFVAREKLGLPATTDATWARQLELGLRVQAAGKAWHAHASTTSMIVADYAFCSWLLVTDFKGSFTASVDYSGAFVKPSPDRLAKVALLGPARGVGYVKTPSGLYSRQFLNGQVLVNPTNVAINAMPARSGGFTTY